MKTQIMIALAALAMPLMAQETNQVSNAPDNPEVNPEVRVRQERPSGERARSERPPEEWGRQERAPEGQKPFKKREIRVMEKALNDIGVTEEQRKQIIVLQEAHMKNMSENWKQLNEARAELSKLQADGATMEQIDAAVKNVCGAQNEQLRILVHNRMEMERILGKEKNDQLMDKAREMFRQHDRRPGVGMPPMPNQGYNMPPVPNQGYNMPPVPPSGKRVTWIQTRH